MPSYAYAQAVALKENSVHGHPGLNYSGVNTPCKFPSDRDTKALG